MINVLLVVIPASIVLCSLAWDRIQLAIEAANNGGDPVTYQHYYWGSAPANPWPLIVYFAIPNTILFFIYVRFRLQMRGKTIGD